MLKKLLPFVLAAVIFLAGIIVLTFPFSSGENAYYVKDSLYLNIKDSVDKGYQPYLHSLLQQKQSALAFTAKKSLREQYKDLGDSLNAASLDAKLSRKAIEIEKNNILVKELNALIRDKEFEIDENYNVNNIERSDYQIMLDEIKQKTPLEAYLTAVANEQLNYSDQKLITSDQISIKKVNQQDKEPFVISGLLILACGVFMLLYKQEKIPLDKTTVQLTSGAILLVVCIFLVSKIYFVFANRILFDKTLEQRETAVKEKLIEIRTAELNYYEAKNKYCNDWEELIRFYEKDSITIVKYLVNKNDTAAVNQAKRSGMPIEEFEKVPALQKAFPNKKIDLKNLPFVPFSENTFELNAGIVDKNGRNIHVFEVKTSKFDFVKDLKTIPDNFDKSKSLILGSMTEPITEGNW